MYYFVTEPSLLCHCRRPRPVITVVDAKPMSETGFRQEQKTAERPKPSPRDTSKSSNWDSSPSSPGSTSVGLVEILPERQPSAKPTKAERNFAVRYNPNPTDGAAKHSVSPENVTTSTTRPVPHPRPKSMVQSRSEPTRLSIEKQDASNDKRPPPVRPEPATRPAPPATKLSVLQPVEPKSPRKYHSVGSSIWYDGNVNVPPKRPPPVKPKPVVTPTSNGADKTAEQVLAKTPPDVGRRKPTIIRPVSSIDPSICPPVFTTALPLQGQTTVTVAAASNSVVFGAETSGWNKPASCTQQSGFNMVGDVGVKPAAEGVKPQPKKRPTVIRTSRTAPSDGECAAELLTDGQPPSDSADEEQRRVLPQSSVKVSHSSADHGPKSQTAVVADSQPHVEDGSFTAGSRQIVTQESADHQLKPMPRSESQPLHSTEPNLDTKVPPAKPPPPRPQSTAPEHNTAV